MFARKRKDIQCLSEWNKLKPVCLETSCFDLQLLVATHCSLDSCMTPGPLYPYTTFVDTQRQLNVDLTSSNGLRGEMRPLCGQIEHLLNSRSHDSRQGAMRRQGYEELAQFWR